MSVNQLETPPLPDVGRAAVPASKFREVSIPCLEEIPLHIRNVAALRGLGFTFRQIGRAYGVTPQAASIMLARQRALLKAEGRRPELAGLSPRAVNCLGRLGIHHRAGARAVPDLAARLQNQRNCGQKTIREILDWAAG
jgi:hypothetical protein